MLLKNLKKVLLIQPKEIEYIKILINLDESLMITLININLKANQSKVTEAREGGVREDEESTSIITLKNYYKN